MAAEAIPSRLADFGDRVDELVQLRPRLLGAIVAGVERRLREGKLVDPHPALRLILDVAKRFPSQAADSWDDQIATSIAGSIAHGANGESLEAAEIEEALGAIGMTAREPVEGWRDRGPSDTWDAGMVALNTLRGEVTTAVLELLFEAKRRGLAEQLDAASDLLRNLISHPDGAIPVRAALGIRLPWLLSRDAERRAWWLDQLLGPDVPDLLWRVCWQAYVLYSRLFTDTVELLEVSYRRALTSVPSMTERASGPRDEGEQLGVHVAWAYVVGVTPEQSEARLTTFFEQAPDWLRAYVTRWIAEQAAEAQAPDDVRDRALRFLKTRVDGATGLADAAELAAISWIAASGDERTLADILLPALEKSGGRAENEQGAAELAARMAARQPAHAARAMLLLIQGDRWHGLPHLARDALRQGLATAIGSGDAQAVRSAREAVHRLGAQGFLDFKDLLDDASSAP